LNEGNVLAASNEEITDILSLNEKLANYALSIPSFSTTEGVDAIKSLSVSLPKIEAAEPRVSESILRPKCSSLMTMPH
jgi:hypothetical protein